MRLRAFHTLGQTKVFMTRIICLFLKVLFVYIFIAPDKHAESAQRAILPSSAANISCDSARNPENPY